jgi:hypothetical protein
MFLFKKKDKNEIIVLSHLINVDKDYLSESIYHFNGSHKDLKQRSKKKYEKLDSEKVKELNNKFITYKMKSIFSHEIKIDNTKIYEIDSSWSGTIYHINIYENNYINKLFFLGMPYFDLEKEVKGIYALKGELIYTVNKDKIISVIELDNHDLIILFENKKKDIYNTNQEIDEPFYTNEYMLIYRLENNNYSLIQKDDVELSIKFLEKLSGNRFLSIFLKKVDIYSLNKNNKYSIIESFPIYNVCRFHEISKGKFIFFSYKKKFLNNDNYIPFDYIPGKLDDCIKKKKELMMDKENENSSVLKIFCSNELFYEYKTNDEKIDLSDFIVLKNKYGIIMINNDLLLLDILKKKIIKKYTMLYYNDDGQLIILNDYKIKKWNNINDNEFILIMNGNIILFEIKDKSEINLEILA